MLREDLECREREALAAYAMRSSQAPRRRHPEPEHPYRTCFQRDRDRIIHCKAFRRLEYKTQVFLNHEGDHYRTRLTHTIEVDQISRTISRALGLNEDLTEAAALAHDLGHTPFGHAGEETLNAQMVDYGGFEHNAHGLRVVDLLERQYPDFPGLNLTEPVRECIAKHHTRWDEPSEASEFPPGPPPLEGQVVEVADPIAYDNHDLADGLEAGIIALPMLREVRLWRDAEECVREARADLSDDQIGKQTVRFLINLLVTDVVETSRRALSEEGGGERAQGGPANLVRFSRAMWHRKVELEDFLHQTLYRDFRVVRVTNTARRFLEEIWKAYVQDPCQLPPQYQKWAEDVGLYRAVCDYVAGMTDRYAQEQYAQLFLPFQRL